VCEKVKNNADVSYQLPPYLYIYCPKSCTQKVKLKSHVWIGTLLLKLKFELSEAVYTMGGLTVTMLKPMHRPRIPPELATNQITGIFWSLLDIRKVCFI
jgi:hypothetical protein